MIYTYMHDIYIIWYIRIMIWSFFLEKVNNNLKNNLHDVIVKNQYIFDIIFKLIIHINNIQWYYNQN